ncbi:MAG: VCBS repeat-containing protein [Candidatus Doudnabacteria bacterium]|nr:VCBS repeat-containing protein [Candidatus Doudnabacteria bacterium]
MKRPPWVPSLFAQLPLVLLGFFAVALVGLVTKLITDAEARTDVEITVDPAIPGTPISPHLFGGGTGSSFAPLSGFSDAFGAYPPTMVRVTPPVENGARMLLKLEDGVPTILAKDDVPYTPGTSYALSLSSIGSTLSVSVDGKRILSARDTTFSSGTSGLMTSYLDNASFDDVVIQESNGSIRSIERFSSGVPSDWTSGNLPSWFYAGTWNTQDARLVHTGAQQFSFVSLPDALESSSISVTATPSPSNEFSAGYIGLTTRHQDPLNGYRFIWRGERPQPFASSNPWGVHDWEGTLRTVQELNAEPVVVANLRGTPQEAAELVRDLNVRRGLGVRYFELGSEPYAYGDSSLTVPAYIERYKEFRTAMLAVDSSIQLGLPLLISDSTWDEEVLPELARLADFAVLHPYVYFAAGDVTREQVLASPTGFAESLNAQYGNDGMIAQARRVWGRTNPEQAQTVPIFITEFNTGSEVYGRSQVFGITASNWYGRFAEQGVSAALFQTMNAGDNHWNLLTYDLRPRPAELARRLAAETLQGISIQSTVAHSPTVAVPERAQLPAFPALPEVDSYAAYNADRSEITLLVPNSSRNDQQATIRIPHAFIDSSYRVSTLRGTSESSHNEETNEVYIDSLERTGGSSHFSYTLPASSVSAFTFSVTKLALPDDNPALAPIAASSVVVSGIGQPPRAAMLDAQGNTLLAIDLPEYVEGGFDVATGDVDNDGGKEFIVVNGAGGTPTIRVYSPEGRLEQSFQSFHPDFRGGLHVATGQADLDPQLELIVSQASEGQGWVRIYDLFGEVSIQSEWNAYGAAESGADVTFGDVDRDGIDEVITGAGPGGGPHVRVFEPSGTPRPISFIAFHPDYRGGLSVDAGDIDGDGKDELAISQRAEQAWVKVVRATPDTPILGEWRAFDVFPVGAHIAIDDEEDRLLVGACGAGAPHLRSFRADGSFDGLSVFPFSSSLRGGMEVAAY